MREEASQHAPGCVRVDRREGVAIVTLDHPADRNALSPTMTRGLAEAVHQVTSDDGIGTMVRVQSSIRRPTTTAGS